jgi:hypothetical protein
MAVYFATLLLPVATAGDLSGVWEISSLGGDRRVDMWQKGDQLVAYRVLYPEFEGERYKLEHLFRGTISGNEVEGELLVREEGMRTFDSLRGFRGRVEGETIILDGLPLNKRSDKVTSQPPQTKRKKRRVRRGSRMSAVAVRLNLEVA